MSRRRGSALAHGCGMGGHVLLPLARAAAVATGLSVQHGQRPAAAVAGQGRLRAPAERSLDAERIRHDAQRAAHLGRVRDRVRVRVRVRVGVGLRVGVDVVALG